MLANILVKLSGQLNFDRLTLLYGQTVYEIY
jgi:hypothetical protein